MSTGIKAQRPNRLTEEETLTSFEDWRNNLIFYLNQETSFQKFLKSGTVWEKSSGTAQHRGLDSADELLHLNNFLGVIASLAPPLLHGDLIDDTTSLVDVFKQLRTYYQFAPSEGTFIKFIDIKRETVNGSLERPLHLYLRLRQFIRENLLLSSGKIQHNGNIPTSDETLSPTTERLIVLRWLEILHPALPNHVSHVFAHDLQTKSLKDLQPRITEQLDDLLRQVDDLTTNVAHTGISSRTPSFQFGRNAKSGRGNFDTYSPNKSFSRRGNDTRSKNWNPRSAKQFPFVKKCDACYSVGVPFIGHTIRNCPNIASKDRDDMLKSFSLEVDDYEDDDFEVHDVAGYAAQVGKNDTVDISRINIVPSPQFNVKVMNTMVTMVMDTGATGSMISVELCHEIGLKIYPSPHSAIQADGDSVLKVVGEVHTNVLMDDNLSLPLHAVVVQKLKAGLLVGMSFMKEHEVVIDIPQSLISVGGKQIVYFSNYKGNPKISLLRMDANNVIFPGETINVPFPVTFKHDHELALEPREESEFWFHPCVVANKNDVVTLINESEFPIKVRKGQIVGQARSVVHPLDSVNCSDQNCTSESKKTTHTDNSNFTEAVTIDSTNTILSCNERAIFKSTNDKYNSVFRPKYGRYNDKSGKIVAHVHLGKTTPVPKKGKVPSYNSKKSALLQEKFDELIELGVLSRPEDDDIKVVHTSPSFLVKKSNDSFRLVTSFVELNKYIQPLPAKLSTTNDVLTALGRWKYLIKADLKSAYFQIRMDHNSKKWLGTNSPYKGMYVYNVAAMGLKNMAEYLEELVSRVFGHFLAQGVLTKIADDLFIGGNTISDLSFNWNNVLQVLKDNNLCLSADKTFICPASISVIGWNWSNGKIAIDPHRINPLSTCALPETVKQLRSFIGAFRAFCRCIPHYGKYLSPLEDLVAGKESSDKVSWNDELRDKFATTQNALKSPKVLTLPHPSDQLILVSDGCNSPPAVGSTLYIKRGEKLMLGGFFSAKIGKHQLLWLPCEIEALCINLSISAFSQVIRESEKSTKFLTDSKACVQAFDKLSRGAFSLSPRISSFLMNLNSLNVSINHISGSSIALTDFSSRNPIECLDKSCQVCQFVYEQVNLSCTSVNVSDIENGTAKMPFYNPMAWKEAQKSDPDLKRCFSQLSAGTRPGKKERNLNMLRRYLQIASISDNGVLIHRKANPYGRDYELVIVPANLAPGLISALHIHLGHPTRTQFKRVWARYFFAIEGEKLINDATDACPLCTSLKTLPKELVRQGTSEVPDTVGRKFSADVIRRDSQKILVLLDLFSSFMIGQFVPNEKHDSLREALIQLSANYKHPDGCSIKVDNAPGFQGLKSDKVLNSIGIELDFGRVKNKNQNASVDKGIQELEKEIIRMVPEGGKISPVTLALAISNLNHRIRSNGLCAKEVLLKRDMHTNKDLNFSDHQIQTFKYAKRVENHSSSELSKSRGSTETDVAIISEGDIVHVRTEGSKHRARDFYLVMFVNSDRQEAYIQKFCGNQLRSKRYRMKLSELYHAATNFPQSNVSDNSGAIPINNESSYPRAEPETLSGPDTPVLRRSERIRHPPDYLATGDIQRIPDT